MSSTTTSASAPCCWWMVDADQPRILCAVSQARARAHWARYGDRIRPWARTSAGVSGEQVVEHAVERRSLAAAPVGPAAARDLSRREHRVEHQPGRRPQPSDHLAGGSGEHVRRVTQRLAIREGRDRGADWRAHSTLVEQTVHVRLDRVIGEVIQRRPRDPRGDGARQRTRGAGDGGELTRIAHQHEAPRRQLADAPAAAARATRPASSTSTVVNGAAPA